MVSDIVVIGAGIVGAACARALSRAGMAVTVLDSGATASATSAQGEGNLLVSDKAPGPELRLAQYAARLWPEVVAELTDQLPPRFPSLEFERKGGLVVATADTEALFDFATIQRAAGVDARLIDSAAARELEPDLTPDVTGAVHYPEDAQVQPVVATEALLASARLSGVQVRTGVTVTGGLYGRDGRLTGVTTTAGDVPAAAVLVAAGPWSGEVSAALGAPLPVRPRRGMVLVTTRMPHRIFHKVYDGDYVGATQSTDAALQTSSVVESTASGTVLLGSSREQVGFDDRLRVQVLREIAAKAVGLFPFLAGASIMRTYGGFRPYMPDHLPVIGQDHRVAGLWHASGHEGAGIGLSLATAELISVALGARADERFSTADAAYFLPDRPSLLPHLEEAA